MSQKLLQKRVDKFLQQAVPENLVANKPLDRKQKKYCRKQRLSGGASALIRQMQSQIWDQWLDSCYTLTLEQNALPPQTLLLFLSRPFSLHSKNALQKITNDLLTRESTDKFCALPAQPSKSVLSLASKHCREWTGGLTGQKRFLELIPGRLIPANSLEIALGGGLVARLNQSLEKGRQYTNVNCNAQLVEDKVLSPAEQGSEEFLSPYGFLREGQVVEKLTDVCNYIREQCRSNYWNMIYSGNEVGRMHRNANAKYKRHGKGGDYRNQLTECRKIAILYGNLPRKTLVRAMRRARKYGGAPDALTFFSYLEMRLDTALKRICFFPTFRSARQWIRQGKILINKRTVTICSYQLQPADLISIAAEEIIHWRNGFAGRGLPPQGMPVNMDLVERMGRKSGCALRCLRQRLCRHSPLSYWKSLSTRPMNSGMRQIVEKYAAPSASQVPSRGGVQLQNTQFFRAMADNWSTRRFLLSPFLLQRWKHWSCLWSNERTANSLGCTHKTHSWFLGHSIFACGRISAGTGYPLGEGSIFQSYFPALPSDMYHNESGEKSQVDRFDGVCVRQAKVTPGEILLERRGSSLNMHRRETRIQRWFQDRLCYASPTVAKHGGDAPSLAAQKRKGTAVHGKALGINPVDGTSPIYAAGVHPIYQGLFFRRRKRYGGGDYTVQPLLDLSQRLQQQPPLVVDGLYFLRSSRLYGEATRSWRWIKPLHLEVSYKLGTAIVLYPPQKLHWPACINFSLLEKALKG